MVVYGLSEDLFEFFVVLYSNEGRDVLHDSFEMVTELDLASVDVEDFVDLVERCFFTLSDTNEGSDTGLIRVEGFFFVFPLGERLFFSLTLLLLTFFFETALVFHTLVTDMLDVLDLLLVLLERF